MSKSTAYIWKLKNTIKSDEIALTENKLFNFVILYDNGEIKSWIQNVKHTTHTP